MGIQPNHVRQLLLGNSGLVCLLLLQHVPSLLVAFLQEKEKFHFNHVNYYYSTIQYLQ